jgi:hypothetical protein
MELELAGRRFPVGTGDLILGSDPSSGVVLPGASPRHAVVRALGDKMATIRPAVPGLEVMVNTTPVATDPTPLLHGDVIRIGEHTLTVVNPAHPVGTATTPPEGARERLHDTLFGVPKADLPGPLDLSLPAPEPGKPAASRFWIIAAAVISVALILFLLLR